ncbi:MAG: histidine kinase [Desulfobacterales bacterium]|nr:histidine kinase [Desulfobacterales bacterium]
MHCGRPVESLEQRVRERTMDLQNLTEQLERSRHHLRNLALGACHGRGAGAQARIAGVLHDQIAQTLAATRMRLDLASGHCVRDQQDRQTLKEAAKALLAESIDETRALMMDIGDPVLYDMGLKAACESLTERLMDRHPIRFRCDIEGCIQTP